MCFKKVESRAEQKGHFFTVPGQLVTTTESIGEVSPSSARYTYGWSTQCDGTAKNVKKKVKAQLRR